MLLGCCEACEGRDCCDCCNYAEVEGLRSFFNYRCFFNNGSFYNRGVVFAEEVGEDEVGDVRVFVALVELVSQGVSEENNVEGVAFCIGAVVRWCWMPMA